MLKALDSCVYDKQGIIGIIGTKKRTSKRTCSIRPKDVEREGGGQNLYKSVQISQGGAMQRDTSLHEDRVTVHKSH